MMKALKKHPVQMIDEYTASGGGGGNGSSEAYEGCSKHGKPFEVFCATCMVPLCMTCAFLDHKGDSHDTGDLPSMATRFVQQVVASAAPIEQQQTLLDQAVVAVKAAKAGIAQTKNAADAVVEAFAKKMQQAVTRYATRGKAAVKEGADAKAAVLDEQLLVLNDARERVRGALRYHRYAVDPSRSPAHALEAVSALVPGLQLLAGLDHPMAPRVSANLIHAGNPAAIISAIEAFGSVVTHDADPSNCVVAGTGVEKAWAGEEAEFTVELRDGENVALQDLPAEAALAMVAVTAVAQVAVTDGGGGAGGGGGGGAGGGGGTVAVSVSTTCAGGGALLTCKYTVPPPTSEEDGVPDMAVEIDIRILGQSVPRSPFQVPILSRPEIPSKSVHVSGSRVAGLDGMYDYQGSANGGPMFKHVNSEWCIHQYNANGVYVDCTHGYWLGKSSAYAIGLNQLHYYVETPGGLSKAFPTGGKWRRYDATNPNGGEITIVPGADVHSCR
jgi:hypothetical protein